MTNELKNNIENKNDDNNEYVQDLILRLTQAGAVRQEDDRELCILTERMKGNGIVG